MSSVASNSEATPCEGKLMLPWSELLSNLILSFLLVTLSSGYQREMFQMSIHGLILKFI